MVPNRVWPRRRFLAGSLSLAALAVARGTSADTAGKLDDPFAAGKSRTLFELHESGLMRIVHAFAVDASGRRAAVFGPDRDDLTLIDVATGKRLFQGKVPRLGLALSSLSPAIYFSDDGARLYWASGGDAQLVCFDVNACSVLATYDVGAFHCQQMAIDSENAYFTAQDFSVVKVALDTGKPSDIALPEGIVSVFRGHGGVYGRLLNFRGSKGQPPHPADGLPLNANRPVKLVSLSPATFGARLTLPPASPSSFFLPLPDERWAIASEGDHGNAEPPQLIIADPSGQAITAVSFSRPALALSGFALAGGSLFISAEDATEPIRQFTTDGAPKAASTFVNSGRLGALEMRGAGDKLFVSDMYQLLVFE
jgi:hypothetical protein